MLCPLKPLLALSVGVLMTVFSLTVRADPFPMLSEEQAAQWLAVGQVNAAGFRVRSACTGTLIAPDLVATAAHCVEGRAGLSNDRYFVAGWNRGDYAARGVSAEILIHPFYNAAVGATKYPYDLALILLEDPLDPVQIKPVPLAEPGPFPTSDTLLLGYHRRRPHVLSGSDSCVGDPSRFDALIAFDCEVVAGNSGGPVLHKGEKGWVLTAVIVARSGSEGQALAAPVDTWMRDIWRKAQKRATAAD